MTEQQLTAILATVQYDASGVGHCWRPADLLPDAREAIAAEILDGRTTCRRYVATDGTAYRWGV